MVWSSFRRWLEEQQIVPYQDACLVIEIIQKVCKEPRKRKEKYVHSQRLNLIDYLIENSLLTLLHHLIHNLHTAIHILKVLTEVSNEQKMTIIRHPYERLIGLLLAETTKQEKAGIEVHALGIADALEVQCYVLKDVCQMLSIQLFDQRKGPIHVQGYFIETIFGLLVIGGRMLTKGMHLSRFYLIINGYLPCSPPLFRKKTRLSSLKSLQFFKTDSFSLRLSCIFYLFQLLQRNEGFHIAHMTLPFQRIDLIQQSMVQGFFGV